VKALITGGAGFIGSNLAEALLNKGFKIIIIDDLSSGYQENMPIHPDIHFIKGTITDDKVLEEGFSFQPDLLFHLAALFANQNSVEHPFEDLMVNGFGTLKVLEAARLNKTKWIVYSSTSCVYENSNLPLHEEFNKHLETPYAITKLLGEHYASYYHTYHKLPITILRYFNCYGMGEKPGVYRNVIPNFINLALKRKQLPITGTGEETRAFTYVSDIIKGTILAAENDAAIGEVFNIGTREQTKIIDIAKMINEITDNNAGVEYHERRKWDRILTRSADVNKAKKILGFETEVELRDGLKHTIEWIRQIRLEEKDNR